MKQIFILLLITNTLIIAQTTEFIKGVDVSFIPQIEDSDGAYYLDGVQTDPVEIFNQKGVGYIRLRLWHTPANGYCGLESTIQLASRVKQSGLKFLLDLHYSDTWADPAHQTKPLAWQSLSYTQLLDSIYSYTYYVVQAFNSANALPDMIQIGNEITSGFLWPEGRVGGSYDNQWLQFTNLLKRAINAVHDAASDSVKIMIHIDRGGNNSISRWYFDNIRNYGVSFDVIGLSYYPFYSSHGTLTGLRQNINDIALRYDKEIIIAETAYPWTLNWYDNTGNIVGNSNQLHNGYPASIEGQYSFVYDLIQIVKEVPGGKGAGIFYWAPEWISTPSLGSAWENVALFDFQGNALNSMRVFKEVDIDTSNAINVTFNFNTATNFDTLSQIGFVQLRGEVVDGADVLASGENISWDINSGIILKNTNGDYWQTTVRVIPGTELNYKYWTGHSINKPTFLRLGWEGPIQPYDLTSGNYRKFVAGNQDTVLNVEYYSSSGTSVNQSWKPFEPKQDSIAIYFRVNMGGVTSTGRFNPDSNGPIGVRGGPVDGFDILSWAESKILSREELSVNSGSFWSGTIYYPLSLIGQEQSYKFFIENDTGSGWENSISDRIFLIPSQDTTLNWVQFNNQSIVVSVEGEEKNVFDFELLQNYPNPFNPSTRINYSLNNTAYVKVLVYNSLGEEVRILVDEVKNAGYHSIDWNGMDYNNNVLSSGMYLIKLITDKNTTSIKTILLR